MTDALIIGAGPAGLMAAEQLAQAGHKVIVADAMPSVGRKFLMAGKSGLNLTKDETTERSLVQFSSSFGTFNSMIEAFGPSEVQAWALGLEQEIFTGSSGRVFPKAMKASPLLRAWMGRLTGLGVEFKTKWRWLGDGEFQTPEGIQVLTPKVTVLALGGASWSRLGSDGAWVDILEKMGAKTVPFKPANMGFSVDWSPHMAKHFGQPVKTVGLHVGDTHLKGEFVISKTGVEGSGIYAVSAAVRDGATLTLDLLPDLTQTEIAAQLKTARAKDSVTNTLRKRLKLDAVKLALLNEWARPFPTNLADFPFKALSVPLGDPRPMDEAISTAGGVSWDSLDENLRLTCPDHPTYCVGEMLDWEAPTGGYLITGCLASGRWAGLAAASALAT